MNVSWAGFKVEKSRLFALLPDIIPEISVIKIMLVKLTRIGLPIVLEINGIFFQADFL